MALDDLTGEGGRSAQEKSALETVGDIPEAVAGMAVEGVKGLASSAWGALTGQGEAYSESLRRMEDAARERLGQEVYENTVADMGDIVTMIPMMAAAVYRAAASDDPYSEGGELGQTIGEDAIGGLGWTVNNFGKASKAFPLATLMGITGAGRVAGNVGRVASRSAKGAAIKEAFNKANPISDRVAGLMGTEIPGTLKGGKKLVKDYEPGQLYNHAIGDEGLTLKDIIKPAAAGAGAVLGLKLKEDKRARAGGMQQGQSPKGGTAPKKKPKQIKKLPDARDKAKTRPQAKPGKFVKYSKGFVRDKTGKKIKRLSREEVMKRRKAQR